MLQEIIQYYGALIDQGFSGKVVTSFDRGMLQKDIRREQNDRLGVALLMS